MRWLGRIALALLLVAAVAAIWGFGAVRSIEAERVGEDVHLLEGLGGNVAVLRTSAGAVVVDTMSTALQGRRIREMAEQLGGGAVQAIINTHWHLDHTHGNPGFAPGLRTVATARTREHLLARDADAWRGAAEANLPGDTFEGEVHELRIGDKTIRCWRLGRGHTDGDLVVQFVEDRVIHAGDLFFHRRYPNVDLEAGGSLREWGDTLERVLALDFDRVIPGHGAVADRAALAGFRDFVREVAGRAAEAAARGEALDAFVTSTTLTTDAGYESIHIPGLVKLDRAFVLRRAWQEATGAVPDR